MSINNAMLAGVSGLIANSAALSAISDNIANVNTVGYKSNQVDFNTLVTGSAGSDGAAGGVSGTAAQLVAQQGTISSTNSPTDLAISGNGMFVTTTTPSAITPSSVVEYTRAGSFTPNSQGFLVNSAGLFLQGFPANSQGVVQTSAQNLASLAPINVNSVGGTVTATTNAGVNANLNAAQATSTAAAADATTPPGAGAYDPTTNSMTAYDPATGTGVQPDFTIQVPVSDSLGGQRTVQLDFLKSATTNTWNVEVQSVPTSDVTEATGSTAPQGQIAAGTVTFNTDGSLNTAASTLLTAIPGGVIDIGASSATPPATGVAWSSSIGAAAQTLTLDLQSSASGSGLTQFNASSVTQSIDTNGTPFGNLSAVSISANGDVNATFDNGTSRVIGQVALATFPNYDGLTSVSGDAYLASTTSGNVSLKTPGSGGAGSLQSAALESSTVDLSTEFTQLIISQQAYTASSKVITAADQMTQDLLSIIR
jgi:flagellar hook protein FlgE